MKMTTQFPFSIPEWYFPCIKFLIYSMAYLDTFPELIKRNKTEAPTTDALVAFNDIAQ